MRSVVYAGPRSLVVEERATPRLAAGTALIEVGAVGICGSDLHGYTGETGRRAPGMIMGHEVGGFVYDSDGDLADIDSETTVTFNPLISCNECDLCRAGRDNLCPDRQIIGVTPHLDGAYAEYVRVPIPNLVSLGNDVSVGEASLVEPLAVGYHAVSLGITSEPEKVLIIGGGPIGVSCALSASRLGVHEVMVSEPQAHRRGILEKLGYETIDPGAVDVFEMMLDWTGGRGVPLVVDAVGSTSTTQLALRIGRVGEPVVVVGMNEPKVTNGLYDLVTWERALKGSFCYSRAHFEETARWVAEKPLEFETLIERSVSFQDTGAAFDSLIDGSSNEMKVVVVP